MRKGREKSEIKSGLWSPSRELGGMRGRMYRVHEERKL